MNIILTTDEYFKIVKFDSIIASVSFRQKSKIYGAK